jgi:predicted O-linked N-acetylglucosamine transferase (SPINDLY family)
MSAELDDLKARMQDFVRRRSWREAVVDLDRILTLQPRTADILALRGRVLRAQGHVADAIADLESAFDLNPDDTELAGEIALCSLQLGLWEDLDRKIAAVLDGVDRGGFTEPLNVTMLPSSAEQQYKAAARYFAKHAPAPIPPEWKARAPGEKLRIGYFSADFYDHAVAQLIVETLEAHDRNAFEVVGYAFGYPPHDAMHRRIAAAVHKFIDVSKMTDAEIVALARSHNVHIAVDLTGYTGMMRFGIFARGAAPVQVNYVGYPGTLGTNRLHYIISDAVVTPAAHRTHYAEHIVTLPHSYQPNGAGKRRAARALTRLEAGLPATGFVYCSFGIVSKITPDVFDVWARLLKAVEGSVLWLLETNPAAARHLKREICARGVSPDRLIFAPRAPVDIYLGRYALADLVLDTFYYNGHTTGSDALLMGVPMVTRLGGTFAARVGASLLTAVGLPELITDSAEDYETLALRLAREPALLASYRKRLADQALSSPLFDTKRYTRNLEAAYREMWLRHEQGLAPDQITVREPS